jgi:hypothetical protein
MLLKQAASEYKWNLQYGNIALMWRGGCIIRSVFLANIKQAYDRNPALSNLMLDPWFTGKLRECSAGWRRVVALGALSGIPTPCFASALSFYDGYRLVCPAKRILLPLIFSTCLHERRQILFKLSAITSALTLTSASTDLATRCHTQTGLVVGGPLLPPHTMLRHSALA